MDLMNLSNLVANSPSPNSPADSVASTLEEGQFIRLEEKFILPRVQSGEVEAILNHYLKPSYPDPSTKFTCIESTYFDSADFDLYQKHFGESSVRRCKPRLRKYGPNGKWDHEQVLLELKSKANGVCEKQRLRLPLSQYESLMNGNPIRVCPELKAFHPKLTDEKLSRRVAIINQEILRYRLLPVCQVRYVRKAFEKDGFRVTVDDQVEFEMLTRPSQKVVNLLFQDRPIGHTNHPVTAAPLSMQFRAFEMLRHFDPRMHLLMEVKHTGTIPAWMQRLLRNRPVQKASFSKYCYSVTKASLSQAPQAGLKYTLLKSVSAASAAITLGMGI